MAIQPLTGVTADAWLAALPAGQVTLLYKHSPRCGISFVADDEVEAFAERHPATPVYRLDVLQHHGLARDLATRLGVTHHSPQVILLRDRRPVWHTSHSRITRETLADRLAAAAAEMPAPPPA